MSDKIQDIQAMVDQHARRLAEGWYICPVCEGLGKMHAQGFSYDCLGCGTEGYVRGTKATADIRYDSEQKNYPWSATVYVYAGDRSECMETFTGTHRTLDEACKWANKIGQQRLLGIVRLIINQKGWVSEQEAQRELKG